MSSTTIQRWGNSNAVRIPKSVLEEAGLGENDTVDIVAETGSIVIRKKRRHRSFEERMAGYNGGYEFHEWDTGPPVGREVF